MNRKLRKGTMNNKKRRFSYLSRQKKNIVFIVIFSLLFVASQLAQPFLLGKALDFAKNNDNNSFYTYLIIASILVIIGTISGYIFEVFVGCLSQNVIKDIRDDVYEKINSISIKQFDKSP